MSIFRRRGLLTAYAMVLITLLATSALGYLNVRRLLLHDQLVGHSQEVLGELRLLLASVTAVESAARGYVIAGHAASRRRYLEAVEAIPPLLTHIHRLAADNPLQQRRVHELDGQIKTRLGLLQQLMNSADTDGIEAEQTMKLGDQGREAMAAIQRTIQTMEAEEAQLLSARRGEARVSYFTAVASSLLSVVIGVGLVGFGLFLTHRDLAARERHAEELSRMNEWLEERVRDRTAAISAANNSLRGEIAERSRAEQATRQLAAELARSNRELTQFAAVASHDLQEPLRKIQAFGDRLLLQSGDQLTDKGRDYLNRILAAAGRMRALIDGLLEYSRVTIRRQPMVSVNLHQVAEDVIGDLDNRLQQASGRVEIGELPTIDADPIQMRQLFQNLIGNALKFRQKDIDPVVRVSGHVVAPPAGGNGAVTAAVPWCELSFVDNGVGFETVYAERIFDLFQRLHGRNEYEGTGMGLAICKKIVERHGGKISATGQPGEGSRFTVLLPMAHSQEVSVS
jgi:signal transduction histidine kinase/CHASE3 domain sensor protein